MKYAELSLNKNQYIFLTRITENQGISFKDLTIMLKVDKATTTTAVQKLIKNGYVIKKRDEQDGRIFRLYPTERSINIYEHIINEENRAIDICFDGFTKKEKEKLHGLIGRMNKNIEVDWFNIKNYK